MILVWDLDFSERLIGQILTLWIFLLVISNDFTGEQMSKKSITEQRKLFQKINKLFMEEMEKGKSPHDVLFKFIMEQPKILRAYLEAELPISLKQQINWDSLTLQPTNFSTPIVSEKRADIFFSIKLQSEKEFYIYLMFEHQSSDLYHMAWRFYEYSYLFYKYLLKSKHNGILPKGRTLPFIFPLLLYNGLEKWNSPTSFQNLVEIPDGCEEFTPHFQFLLKDLSQSDDSVLKNNYKDCFILAKFAEFFKYSRHPHFYERLEQDLDFTLLFQEDRDTLFAFYVYILQTQKNPKGFRILLNNKMKSEDDMLDVIELLKEEGIQKGLEKGREEGREEGARLKAIQTTKEFLKLGVSIEVISQGTGLSIEEVRKLQDELKE